jgi:hypothetical protein
MDFSASLNAKGLFRFTGPPENWLTAIKYMTWGLEEKYKDRWREIQPGDIFFIHSTGKSFFNNAKSGIIGLGIVGDNFTIKDSPLWIHEIKDKVNRWPLLVPFSEIYLFSKIPSPETWQAPNENNINETKNLIDLLLQNYSPLSTIPGFPQMGSFSAVSKDVARQMLYDKRPLHIFTSTNDSYTSSVIDEKPTRLLRMSDASEALRYTTSLKGFKTIETRVVNPTQGQYTKNNALLAKAEITHANVLQELIKIFRNKGYDTLNNRAVDLFAYNEKKSFLFEVKSTENKNFRKQAQKGVIQLFECNYFDIARFVNENKLSFKEKYRVLALSQEPQDTKYVEFINQLNVGVTIVENDTLKPIGNDFGFTKI